MRALPPLLETYEEARLLLEAKGWGVAKGAEHLAEMPGLARFHISQAKLSKKTTPGSKFPIEPEVAAAVAEHERLHRSGHHPRAVARRHRQHRVTFPARRGCEACNYGARGRSRPERRESPPGLRGWPALLQPQRSCGTETVQVAAVAFPERSVTV